MSLFIIIFHKGKYINEKKDRVTVMHIENFTKPLYWVFPTDSFNWSFQLLFFFFVHYCIWVWAKIYSNRSWRWYHGWPESCNSEMQPFTQIGQYNWGPRKLLPKFYCATMQKTRSKGMVKTKQSASTVQWSTLDQKKSNKFCTQLNPWFSN